MQKVSESNKARTTRDDECLEARIRSEDCTINASQSGYKNINNLPWSRCTCPPRWIVISRCPYCRSTTTRWIWVDPCLQCTDMPSDPRPYLATFSMVALVAKSLRKLTRSPPSNTIHIGFVFVSQLKDKLISKVVADAESLVATVHYFQ